MEFLPLPLIHQNTKRTGKEEGEERRRGKGGGGGFLTQFFTPHKCRYEKHYLRNDKVDENNEISDNPTAPW